MRYAAIPAILASLVLSAALTATATATAAPTPSPVAGLHYFVGTWKCTYRAGAVSLAYGATYALNGNGQTLRQVATWTGGGDEELVSYDGKRRSWTAVVLDDQGNATVMHSTGSDPSHLAYRSVYPDASIAVKLDRVSSNEYTTHATVRAGGKTITSVDTCLRSS
jgi:hypothetical protein